MKNDEHIGLRIRELRRAAGYTLQRVADEFGISRASVSEWESGRSKPDSDKLFGLSLLFGVSIGYLLHGKRAAGEQHFVPAPTQAPDEDAGRPIAWENPDDLEHDEDRVWMDQYDYRFSAGTGHIQWEVRKKKALPFDIGFFKALGVRPQDCRLARVHGRSMEPYLFNRDMMMICEAKTHVRDGQIYAVYFEDEALVKQIFKEPDGALRLHSYNPEFPDRIVSGEQLAGLQIVGEVIYRSGSGLAGGN
ncbi:XRE family transcriptional regulator [Burkholderia glumae]|uniref:XRE family transcriptional regulator n=1 Tax=Burkholderia glumae TaxID=337 RepID=A0ABY5BHR0_BURGL|nr:XRE family transcriptional regulator [Burkholderia glumae]USS45096.1 XRE family transcriptional regulator [Burkholderia glumae]